MPHQCTNCGRTFADGSKEMLSGCPDCGGNKFQFRPAGAADAPGGQTPPSASQPDATGADSSAETAGDRAAPASGRQPTAGESGSADAPAADRTPRRAPADGEDGAQASARSDTVSEDEIAAAAPDPADAPANTSEAAGDDAADSEPADPNLDALRRKLNDQFESIRIVSPGQYELNLMELYDREEYIISLREDGRYVIEMPEGWDDR
ncbi:Zn-ribbon domain-containing protein [Halobaculum lipolyticum]|uniref:Zn-ribbon domain-containing protein n=1 Tax=Halobaculum lipolyticum TaxID=3032001 RepID=A0ABD5WDF6_9EURY|nr:Zn-ribbon containing protein [Halobaculum sp. DT31]